jgi:hypothetical protein
MSPGISRREALQGLGVLTAGAAVPANARVPATEQARSGDDPRASAVGQVKLTATLDGSPSFWAYSGLIYAVRPGVRPLAILAVSGCQAQWAERQPDASHRMVAKLLTFFRDPATGAFLEQFDNPFTGQRNPVQANVFSGGGYAVFPADGSAMRMGGQINASQSAPQGFAAADPGRGIGRVQWSLTDDSVVLDTDHAFEVRVQPQLEAQTRTADRKAFFDPRVMRLRARFSATTISPWLAWMDMQATDGHLVWHTAGDKRFDVGALPADYRGRAGAALENLASRPRS